MLAVGVAYFELNISRKGLTFENKFYKGFKLTIWVSEYYIRIFSGGVDLK